MAKQDRLIHRHVYGFLFSEPTLVRELVESFVDESLAAELVFSQFQAFTEKSYITDEFRDFADDLLIKVGLRGKAAFIYLLLEFQSTPGRFMALRLLNYLCQVYIDLKENKNAKVLPPVLPIVPYNGRRRWNAPAEMRELIEPHEYIGRYYP